MRDFRTFIALSAVTFVALRAWFTNQGLAIADWVWIFVVSSLLFAVSLGLRRDRPYARKLAIVVALAAVISGIAILCTTPPPQGDCSQYPQSSEQHCAESVERGNAVRP